MQPADEGNDSQASKYDTLFLSPQLLVLGSVVPGFPDVGELAKVVEKVAEKVVEKVVELGIQTASV